MKKVGIITFHHAKHSYGAALQALATLRAIENMGFDAELINYENKYEQAEIKIKGKSNVEKIRRILNWCLRMFVFGGFSDPNRKAENLDRLYGKVSSLYRTSSDLKNIEYDILVSGSDQIWNPEVTGGIDRNFLLDFGNPQKRIAYASSIGSHKFTEEELTVYRELLSKFDYIGVREQYASDSIQSICQQKVKVVCDPTLLITGMQWRSELKREMESFSVKEPYILTYFVGGNIESYWNRIGKFVKQIDLPVYNIQSHSKRYGHVSQTVYNIMPGDLVAYIENAQMILTDSFHGTAFSINLNKEFVAVLNMKNPVRVMNMLDGLGLEGREDDKLFDCSHKIDYTAVNERLNIIRNDSKIWLSEALM